MFNDATDRPDDVEQPSHVVAIAEAKNCHDANTTSPKLAAKVNRNNKIMIIIALVVLVTVCAAVAIGVGVSQASSSSTSTSTNTNTDDSNSHTTTSTAATTTANSEIVYTAEWDSWKGWPDLPYRWGPKVGGMNVGSTAACQTHCKSVQAEYGVYWRNNRHDPNCDCYLFLAQLGCPLIPNWYSGGTFFAIRDPGCFRPPE